jgi:DNA-binding Xre family transcriptional regulator/tetratricopeptide (TPR) repeat protein
MPRSLKVAPQYIEQAKSALQRNRIARQQDLAEELGISRDTVSRFFNGKLVGYLNFLELCRKLGLDLDKIAEFEIDNCADSCAPQSSSQCNLPRRDYSRFIGRQNDLEKLLEYMNKHLITIVEGIGGVGKTALVLEAAYRCWESKQSKSASNLPIFDAIIFSSAKDSYLLPNGIIQRPIKEATLHDIFRAISLTLNDPTITQASGQEQIKLVYDRLSKQPTLLIVDNMETINGQDRDDILSFLMGLPGTVKTVITTREEIILFSQIRLESLSEEDSLQLIKQQAEEKGVTINKEQSRRLYNRFGGIPLALIYAIGQKANGYSIKRILDPSGKLPKDIANFCFEGSVKPLREEEQSAHKLLMSIAIFRTPPILQALTEVAGLREQPMEVENGLARLQQLSLIREQEDRYQMLLITREYVLEELAKCPDFEREARDRWIKWYLDFTQKHGGKDWEDWRVKYEALADESNNIEQVLVWCAVHQRYDNAKNLWESIDDYIDLYNFWQKRWNWWTWIIQQSKQRGDIPTYVKAMREKGWTLTLMGSRENQRKADELFTRAWDLKHEIDLSIQASLASDIAVLRMTQEQYEQGLQWLDRAEAIFNNINPDSLEERDRLRIYISIAYYRAEINYLQESYDLAKPLFQEVVEQGKRIGWQRFANYAQNYLADIAVIEGDFAESERLLKTGLLIAESYKEKRRVALYQASYARLEKARGNLDKARKWAEIALQSFINEGIAKETAEMRLLLASLPSETSNSQPQEI